MMKPEETERRLRDMLAEAGIGPDYGDPARTWQVFREFAAVPITVETTDEPVDAFTWECAIVHRFCEGRGFAPALEAGRGAFVLFYV